MAKSKIQVLEALLRLRQAACHPGLIDAKRVRRAQRQARRAAGAVWARSLRGRPQGAGVLAVHQPAGDRARAAGRSGRRLRVPRRHDARPAGARGALPERSGLRPVPDQPEGRRPGPEPDGGRIRLPARPLVEPGGGSAGDRPRAPHRPDAPGIRLPPDRARHGGGEGAGTAEDASATWPRPSSARTTA